MSKYDCMQSKHLHIISIKNKIEYFPAIYLILFPTELLFFHIIQKRERESKKTFIRNVNFTENKKKKRENTFIII